MENKRIAKKYIDAEHFDKRVREAMGISIDDLPIGYPDPVQAVLAMLETEPSIYIPFWIPITDELPAYGEEVLLSMNGDYGIGYLVPTYDKRQYEWHHSGWFYNFDEVDAWMPLPEPYKKG